MNTDGHERNEGRDTMNELIGMMLVSTRIAHSVHICIYFDVCVKKGRSSDLDHMVGIFTSTCAISDYHKFEKD